jgi:hypothetical protein
VLITHKRNQEQTLAGSILFHSQLDNSRAGGSHPWRSWVGVHTSTSPDGEQQQEHWQDQTTTSSDLEEEEGHREEQGTGKHREEQGTRSLEHEKQGRHREERAMLSMSLDLEGQRGH